MDKKLEKDLFKFTEEILKGYKHIEAFIKKTEEQLELKDKEELITTLQAINYDSIKISPTFSINRSTETKALTLSSSISSIFSTAWLVMKPS